MYKLIGTVNNKIHNIRIADTLNVINIDINRPINTAIEK